MGAEAPSGIHSTLGQENDVPNFRQQRWSHLHDTVAGRAPSAIVGASSVFSVAGGFKRHLCNLHERSKTLSLTKTLHNVSSCATTILRNVRSI